MIYITEFSNLQSGNGSCVAFGVFDSIHMGHFAVIDTLVKQSKAMNLCPVLLLLDNKSPAKEVSTLKEKQDIISHKYGSMVKLMPVSQIYGIANFNYLDSLAVFIKDILFSKLNAKAIIAGRNFSYINKDNKFFYINDLEKICENSGCILSICETISTNGKDISDSMVRKALEEGKIKEANMLLGRQFSMLGNVVRGKAMGRTVRMPTANLLLPENKLLPALGVYATISKIAGEDIFGLTNIGRRPSVDNFENITIESYLIDFDKNIYDETVYLELHHYIRGTIKFSGLEQVKEQVLKDIAVAKKLMGKE